MFVFVDESEDQTNFVMTGILINSPRLLEDVIYDTRRKFVRKKFLKKRELDDLNEFHEYILHDRYPTIKRFILENLVRPNPSRNYGYSPEIHALYSRKKAYFNRDQEYIRLSLELLKNCNAKICSNIIFDNYSNTLFQNSVYDLIRNQLNLSSTIQFSHQDSQKCKPIQTVDCVAGCLRRSLLNDDLENFNLLQPLIRKWIKK